MARPNWFVAFPIEGSFVGPLPPPPAGIRAYGPDDLHLTLAFLGGCSEAAAERALVALDRSLREAPLAPISISFGNVVAMGAPRAYSALSALLEAGRTETSACLLARRDAIADAALVRREQRTPKPHVTLARPARRATEAQRAAGLAWAASLDLRHVTRTLDRIALYTWHEPRGERLFRIVAERPLPVR